MENNWLVFNGLLYIFALIPFGWLVKFSWEVTGNQMLLKSMVGVWLSVFLACITSLVIGFCGTGSNDWIIYLMVRSRLFGPTIFGFSIIGISFYFWTNRHHYQRKV